MNTATMPMVLVDGAFKKQMQPAVAATSRGLMYGDGCFETFCAYAGQFFMLRAHLQRLKEGLKYLDIVYPHDLTEEKIGSRLRQLLQKNGLEEKEAVIRMQVWREGGRGYGVGLSGDSHYSIMATPSPQPLQAYRLATVPIKRIPSAALPASYKFTNGINFIKAASEARAKGADDALMQTMDDWISETTIANIFWFRQGAVYTPSRVCDILPGISRGMILELLAHTFEVTVKKGCFDLKNIREAEAVWICNSVKHMVPVSQIDQIHYPIEHPFLEQLQVAFASYRLEQLNKNA